MVYNNNLEELYKNVRQKHVANMQSSLKELRVMLGLSVQSFGEYIGLSRQSVNSLESNRSRLSESQYLAICALIENKLKDKPYLWPGVLQLLKFGYSTSTYVDPSVSPGYLDQSSIMSSYSDDFLEIPSLLNNWFNSFPNTESADEKLRLLLEKIVSGDNKIFVDDTFLSMPGVDRVLELLDPMLLAEHNKLFVPLIVIRKLKFAHQEATLNGDSRLAKRLEDSIKALTMLKNHGLLIVRGETSDSNVGRTLEKVFEKFKPNYNLVLLSGNDKLCEAIDALNETVQGSEIEIYIYEESEGLVPWGFGSLGGQMSEVQGWDTLDNPVQTDTFEIPGQDSGWDET